jgi:hypothetical protein
MPASSTVLGQSLHHRPQQVVYRTPAVWQQLHAAGEPAVASMCTQGHVGRCCQVVRLCADCKMQQTSGIAAVMQGMPAGLIMSPGWRCCTCGFV